MSEINYRITTGSVFEINCYIGSVIARTLVLTREEFTACFKGLFNGLRYERGLEPYEYA